MYGVVFISLTSNIKYVCAKGEGLQVSGAGCRVPAERTEETRRRGRQSVARASRRRHR